MNNPLFLIKNRFQKEKNVTYKYVLTPEILADICLRLTGQAKYTVQFDNEGYNIGRLAKLIYKENISYISFSETKIKSRNSSFQSFSSALVKFLAEPMRRKKLYFYFIQSNGNIETDYFNFMYRLMRTTGTEFLNFAEHLTKRITPFNSVEDIILAKENLRGKNRGNKSTYVTKNENGTLQIYGKTYGANKYETTLLCAAISRLADNSVQLFEISEGNLQSLPKSAREAVESLGNIRIIQSDLEIERREYTESDSLRSPTFIYNLFERFGDKKCVFCDCKIPELIQGAHIWPVAMIKRVTNMSPEKKLECAIDGDNGIWLCNNHHKLFDVNMILISRTGHAKIVSVLRDVDSEYVHKLTVNRQMPKSTLTSRFLHYLQIRNSKLNEEQFQFMN